MSDQSIIDAHAQNEDYWNRTYGRAGAPVQPSSFAEAVVDRGWVGPHIGGIIDLGCGTARDTAYVAQSKPGLGLDYSHVVTEKNRLYWGDHPNLIFQQADVRDGVGLASIFKNFTDTHKRAIALYSRFFLHAIDDEAEASLLTALSGALPSRSIILLEFRTHLDRNLEKVFDNHYRRFVDPDAFLERILVACPARILHQEAARGLAPYKDEDPHVARLVLELL